MTTYNNHENNENEAIKKATWRWVQRFSQIPTDLIVKLRQAGDEIIEITPRTEENCDNALPVWGKMWAFEEIDSHWLQDSENLKKMADCGFRIYEQEDFGYIFGIDGAGYDFYEAHWIPLYNARGLQWHI